MSKFYTPLVLALGLTSYAQATESQFVDNLEVTNTLTFANNYVTRGISGSSNEPVIQGAMDVAHSSGAYAGVWATSGDARGEIDWYAGYVYELNEDFALDVGAARFYYPGETGHQTEGYVTLMTPWVKVTARHDWQYGHNYYELNKAIPLADRLDMQLHLGYKNYGEKKYETSHWAYGKEYADASVKFGYKLSDKHTVFAGYSWHEDDNDDHATEGKVLLGITASF
ncbi:TorF family putative porin [Gallaecimonas sp. GXIMD4217]|uniref:TorF family putative porin n=1 Tax=Gallaecimonas sp. GXIMD4217 TaxID=3131927 RepID=UPI00311AE946